MNVIDIGGLLPSLADLQILLQRHTSIQFTYSTISDEYLSTLTYGFPDHYVSHRAWDRNLSIYPSVASEKILQKKAELFQCATAFREAAHQLMQQMATTFSIDLQTLDGLHELKYKKSQKQRGVLDAEWNYHLHGAECRFENSATGQIVEIIIITKPEFGYLDSYFFYQYMATTPQFKPLAAYFDNDHLQIAKAIDLLAWEGVLTREKQLSINRNVIAL
jgi:hypothetical protein